MVRALRSGSFEHAGCARLLDVLAPGGAGMPADVLGAAVTEWVPGRSLAEVVADGLIKPTGGGPRPSPRWPRRPRRRTGAGWCWAATTRSASGSPRRARCSSASRCPARRHPRRRRPRPGRRPLRAAHLALAAVGRRRGPRRAGRRRAHRRRRARRRRPGSDPGSRSSSTRSSPGTLGPDGRARPRAHRRRGAPAAQRGGRRGRPDRAVPARARRRAVRPGDVWQDDAPSRRRARPAAPAQAADRRDRRSAVAVRRWSLVFLGIQLGLAVLRRRRGGRPSSWQRPAGQQAAAARAGEPGRRARPRRPVGDVAAAAGVEVYDKGGDRRQLRAGRPGHRRQRRQRLEDLHLQAAVPGAQAGHRDHGVVRVARCSWPS